VSNKQIAGNHYQLPIQPIEYIVKNNLGYMEGNVLKYITRHKNKNGAEDIKKAIHYLELLLKHEYGDEDAKTRADKAFDEAMDDYPLDWKWFNEGDRP
jgi:hypothetical protein